MRISDWSSDVCSSDLSDYQVILVREAQAIKKWDALLSYAENPLPSTLLVFCHKYGTLDKRLKVTKMIVKNGTVLESKKRSEEHTSELQSLMRISYAVFCLKKKTNHIQTQKNEH